MGLIDQMMANIYKPPKQEKPNTILPRNLTPAKVANMMNQASVTQGQLLRGEVLDLRANQIMVLLENGATVSARTEGTLNLSIGQNAKFLVAQTTEDQILLKLAREDAPTENPMIDKALTAANITKTERSVSIVTELLSHQQPVNESSIRHYLSLSAKYPELPVKNLVLMELHHIPVTPENVEQFANYQDRNAKLLTQAQDMLQNLAEAMEHLPEGNLKQEALQELKQLLHIPEATQGTIPAPGQNTTQPHPQSVLTSPPGADTELTSNTDSAGQTPLPEIVTDSETALPESTDAFTNLPADNKAANFSDTAHASTLLKEPPGRPDSEPFLRDFLDSFLLKPEDIADPEQVQNYYDELNEKLTRLEQLSQKIAEQSAENNAADAPKQMRQNLSFMEAVNNVFPYIQLPLKFRETPTHGELYVYERKKSMKPSDSLSALLHLELEALGTTDIYVTLAGNHVTTRFSMSDKDSGNLIRSELPRLQEALAVKGYTLTSEVAIREPEEVNTPTLLEQFLEDHAPGGLNRYTFDIRA